MSQQTVLQPGLLARAVPQLTALAVIFLCKGPVKIHDCSTLHVSESGLF